MFPFSTALLLVGFGLFRWRYAVVCSLLTCFPLPLICYWHLCLAAALKLHICHSNGPKWFILGPGQNNAPEQKLLKMISNTMTSTQRRPPPTAVMNGCICLRSCSLCGLTWRVHWRSDAPRGSTNVSAVTGYTPTDPRANNGRVRPDTWEQNTPMRPAVAAAADCWLLLTDSLSPSNQWSPQSKHPSVLTTSTAVLKRKEQICIFCMNASGYILTEHMSAYTIKGELCGFWRSNSNIRNIHVVRIQTQKYLFSFPMTE